MQPLSLLLVKFYSFLMISCEQRTVARGSESELDSCVNTLADLK